MTKTSMVGLVAAIALPAYAWDLSNDQDRRIGKAELVIPGVAPHEAANAIREAISQFAIPIGMNYYPEPGPPPQRPGAPVLKKFMSILPSMYICDGAYAVIDKKPAAVRSLYASSSESHQICLYSFAKGVKVYLMYSSTSSSASLTSSLFNGIRRAIRGSDEERASSQIKENIEKIRTKLPGLLVERIEVSGMPVETPDLEAVAALIPPAEKIVEAPVAAATAAPILSTSLQHKLEARKNLQAMGMTYHSQAQFVEAIRRKDDVAVQLFLEGGGISLEAPDSAGMTPLQIALTLDNPASAALLQPQSPSQPREVASQAPLMVETAAIATPSAAAAPSASSDTAEVDFNQIPADRLAQIDQEVAAMNLSAEVAVQARAQLARRYLQRLGSMQVENP